ncbi:stage II sporulation protein M [Henriciella barbarensis]|uniref:Stage II sporulation protein M n=2 Tax=Henriciella barbarensis TaxID=86342 RepID=A0A399R4I3_9PROT|nr:stage II sporulation protein M [Henriciella barbarensis]
MNDRVMKSYRFREEREADWQALDRIVTRAEKRGVKRLSDEDMLALPRLYRQAVSSLSMARSISLDQNLLAYLETLCARAYFFVYGTRASMGARIAQYFRRDWPDAVSRAVLPTLLAALCLFGGGLLAFILTWQDPEWFWTFNSGWDSRNPDAGYDYLRSTLYTEETNIADMLGAFAAQLFSHNSTIAITAFALGFCLGIPTTVLLVYNGLSIGSFMAVFFSKNLGAELTGWLFIHGVTELFAIVLAGTAGFMIGGAVAFPGKRTRMQSLRDTGNQAALVIMGAVIMLFLAALLEGFGRQLINSDMTRYAIAIGTLIFWLAYFYWPRRMDEAE